MSMIQNKNSGLNTVYKFNNLISNEQNRAQNIQNSPASTTHTITYKKKNNRINRNYSSINITQVKGFSKFKVDKNIKSEKRIYSKYGTSKLLTLLQNSKKTKMNKKVCITEMNKKTENDDVKPKKIRFDNYGNIINKKNKKIVHIVFADELNEKSITEEIQIESFKKFNYVKGLSNDDLYNNSNPLNKCCNIF